MKTISAFRKWLENRPIGSLVGVAESSCDCPLAVFYRISNEGAESVFAGRDHIAVHFDEYSLNHETTLVEKHFMFLIDSRGGEITREVALNYLDRAESYY